VHLVRQSLNFVPWKQRRLVAADLRTIYTAVSSDAAEMALVAFAAKWDVAYPTISQGIRSSGRGGVRSIDIVTALGNSAYRMAKALLIGTAGYNFVARAEGKATQGCDLSADAGADWRGGYWPSRAGLQSASKR